MLLQGSSLCQPQDNPREPPHTQVRVALGWSPALVLALGRVARAETLGSPGTIQG